MTVSVEKKTYREMDLECAPNEKLISKEVTLNAIRDVIRSVYDMLSWLMQTIPVIVSPFRCTIICDGLHGSKKERNQLRVALAVDNVKRQENEKVSVVAGVHEGPRARALRPKA
jgi:hypothetical protein